ncbi:MAG: gamma-glutamyl-gamma-aminobutyrate hydrolase family protein [Acidobacteria bacterium]|nr:gamma-glutamyl-gamma-aminobutyrate hydrolase family protein [Acidobacteriota bacterium]
MPIYIPLIPRRRYLESLSDKLDGLMLSGSASDINPELYGQERHPNLGTVTAERDETDMILLEIAEERRLPVFGICFGIQSLNVSRGGTLIQDIEAQVSDALEHEQEHAANQLTHEIEIEPDSLLARLAGSQIAMVNSSHHQAIAEVGSNLQVLARASDGVIEAVIDPRPDRFVLGVQWHPEVGWENDRFSQALFNVFIEASVRNE